MKEMLLNKLNLNALLLATALTASACVTINIYFPAAAAEKAADRIIDDIYDAKEGAAKPAAPAPAPAEKK
ncbi:MAG: hypothetical protein JWN73_2334 [Betaproteobacteria bacterium]|nr:hypothetical protein [Betaproteobacteria bacterium]